MPAAARVVEHNVVPFSVQPPASSYVQDELVVSDGEVCNSTALGKSVWPRVHSQLFTVIKLIKADVEYHNLCPRLVNLVGVLLLYASDVKELENVFGEEIAGESLVIE